MTPLDVANAAWCGVRCDNPASLGVEFTSGPLLSIDAMGDVTTYSYDAGELRLIGQWTTPDGSPETGVFTATLAPLSFTVEGEEIDDDPDYPFTEFVGSDRGAGRFDAVFARHLGLSQRTGLLTGLYFVVETITGDSSTPTREVSNIRDMTVNIETAEGSVPEPSLLLLGLAGAGGWLRRQRRT